MSTRARHYSHAITHHPYPLHHAILSNVPLPACPTTVAAIELRSELYDNEKGIVREIF